MNTPKTRAPRNRTLFLDDCDRSRLEERLVRITEPASIDECLNRTILGDSQAVLPFLPAQSVDLLVVDPPYNLTKLYNGSSFKRRPSDEYEAWLHTWLSLALPLLKPTASVYVCCEWRSSGVVQRALETYFKIQNRITWEREKGRGALRNWKNCSEDIWFCTVSDDYYFDVEAVKQKRRVIAPYRNEQGLPKDWSHEHHGGFRITFPSNLWTDISVPFWSMPENTDHPTQKPEKLIAKLLLASSRRGDVVLDPFLGSGTTSVVARKLGRHYIGVETETEYSLLAERRLELAKSDSYIQGYSDGVFWERNTLADQQKNGATIGRPATNQPALFERLT
jgi:site-specific DNA-methyltransferase (adenine-specific)